MLKSRGGLGNWFFLFSFSIVSFSPYLHPMEPPLDTQRNPTFSKSSLPPPLESVLRAIGGIVGDSGPTCFIARCFTGEDTNILEEQGRISDCLRLMGIRTILDVKGDHDGLPVGADTQAFMEKEIHDSDFVLYCLTPKVKERNANPLSGVATELTHVVDRLGKTIREKQKPEFLIPLLMAGDEVSSVPVKLRRFLYMEAQRQQGFDIEVFLREMWPLFETRFFKGHPRLREIKELLSRGLVEFGSGFQQEMIVPIVASSDPSLQPRLFEEDPRRFNCSGGVFPKSLNTQGKVFINRTREDGKSYLQSIFQHLFGLLEDKNSHSCVTLCALDGMGGVGKTTLAAEYAWIHAKYYDAVFWIDASSESTLKRSYVSLLKELSEGRSSDSDLQQKTKDELVAEVVDKLTRSSYANWLLICDNAERNEDVDDLLSLSRGHILCTSRHREWRNKIDVGLLREEESLELLYRVSQLERSTENDIFARQLVNERLGNLALAITQAGSYIFQSHVKGRGIFLKNI